ncbi:hypothetical protein V3C99_015416, partial [Haemonchus contortus]
ERIGNNSSHKSTRHRANAFRHHHMPSGEETTHNGLKKIKRKWQQRIRKERQNRRSQA